MDNQEISVPPSPENIHLWPFMKMQYNYAVYEGEDPRIMEWPLMNRMYLLAAASMGYILFFCWLSPRLMMNRKPMKLKNILLVYNLFQVIFNVWIVSLCIRGGWFTGYSFICQPIDFSRTPKNMLMVAACYLFFISKLIDWLDTAFFTLRKSYGQMTFLHVAHHGGMPFCTWYAIKFVGVGHSSFVILLNSCTHVLMYSYYFLSGLGPRYQKFLWWKPYVTVFQIVQFVLMSIHQFQLFFVDCDYPTYPRMWALLAGPAAVVFFADFYFQAYADRKSAGVKVNFYAKIVKIYSEKYACFSSTAFQEKKASRHMDELNTKSERETSRSTCIGEPQG